MIREEGALHGTDEEFDAEVLKSEPLIRHLTDQMKGIVN